MSKGLFVVLEGIDGCGKSTQARLLEERLKQENKAALLTREPGGTGAGEGIRNLLLSPESQLCTCAEILLYAAARAQLVEEVIRPALEAGQVVVCDRFVWSSLAYQGAGRGGDMDKIYQLNREVTQGVVPDLTVILDINEEEAQKRLGIKHASEGDRDRLEKMDHSFYRRVRQKYLSFAREAPSPVSVISSEGSPKDVHERIWLQVKEMLSNR